MNLFSFTERKKNQKPWFCYKHPATSVLTGTKDFNGELQLNLKSGLYTTHIIMDRAGAEQLRDWMDRAYPSRTGESNGNRVVEIFPISRNAPGTEGGSGDT